MRRIGPLMVVLCLACQIALFVGSGCGKKPEGETTTLPARPPEMLPHMPTEGAAGLSGKKVVMVIAPEGFRDEEYEIPKEALTAAGVTVTTASLQAGECRGAGGTKAQAEVSVAEINAADYDGIVFVGGPGMAQYLSDEGLTALAKQFHDARNVVAAICVAPVILANAGILDGVEATCWEGNTGDIEAKGAVLSSRPVVASGNIITANGPSAAKEFADAVIEALKTSGT